MGNNNPFLTRSKTAVVAASETWIEGRAIQQLEKTAELDGMVRAVGMPDLHPGRGYPIGAAFLSDGMIYPALVGNDIGCGMSLWATSITSRKAKPEKLTRKLVHLDGPLKSHWSELVLDQMNQRGLETTGFESSLGTIGGGNHFAELQAVDAVFDPEAFDATGLKATELALLVHSGSRGFGQQILTQHVTEHGHRGLSIDSDSARYYLRRHHQALVFAELNRWLIAQRFMVALGCDGEAVLDVNHNLVEPLSEAEARVTGLVSGWLHRKGATPANRGLVMIPGSRGHASYLVRPIVSGAFNSESLSSLAHGAGRKWMRADCRARLDKRCRVEDLKRTRLGSQVVCEDKVLMYEEAPEAYKPIDTVINAMTEAGLIELVARFLPVVTYKTRGGC